MIPQIRRVLTSAFASDYLLRKYRQFVCRHEWRYYPAAFFKDMCFKYKIVAGKAIDLQGYGLFVCNKCEHLRKVKHP